MNREMLGMLAEELRSGLASILGYSRTLELRARRLTEEERVEFAGRISAQAERLARLADYLQSVARITPDHEPADAAAVVRAVTTELAEVIRAHGVTTELHLASSLPARAGADALRQIVASLVLAALQVTSDGSTLHISARPSRGQAVLRVAATAARPEVTSGRNRDRAPVGNFSQADDPATWSTTGTAWTSLGPGTELGLSLVRHLVEAHGGTLEIDLARQGMTVCVQVPLASDDRAGPAGPSSPAPATGDATREGPDAASATAP